MEKLTSKQKSLLHYIENHIAHSGKSPSYREIAKEFGFSSLGSVWRHVKNLQKKGHLQQDHYQARSLHITRASQKKEKIVLIPFLGFIKEGFPIETFAQLQERPLLWSWPHISPDNVYLLQVKESSFRHEMVLPGDFLIIEGRSTVEPGQMAIVMINEAESLLKRVWIDEEFARLEAGDGAVRSMILRRENVQIQGVLIGLLRDYSVKPSSR